MTRAGLGSAIAMLVMASLTGCSASAGDPGIDVPSSTVNAEPSGVGAPSGPLVDVERVVDGDTIVVRDAGDDVRVRLIGVDSPESVRPETPVQCYAIAASNYTKHALTGARVRLEYDVERHDRYGRTLAYVWLGGRMFNEVLVEQGYAVVETVPPDVRYVDRFLTAQRDARQHERGLWSACSTP